MGKEVDKMKYIVTAIHRTKTVYSVDASSEQDAIFKAQSGLAEENEAAYECEANYEVEVMEN